MSFDISHIQSVTYGIGTSSSILIVSISTLHPRPEIGGVLTTRGIDDRY